MGGWGNQLSAGTKEGRSYNSVPESRRSTNISSFGGFRREWPKPVIRLNLGALALAQRGAPSLGSNPEVDNWSRRSLCHLSRQGGLYSSPDLTRLPALGLIGEALADFIDETALPVRRNSTSSPRRNPQHRESQNDHHEIRSLESRCFFEITGLDAINVNVFFSGHVFFSLL
jgi:hypothetical protein